MANNKNIFLIALLIVLFVFSFFVSGSLVSAEIGTNRHILSHDKELVVTDPSKGYNSYANWTLFPSENISYRKIVLNITYACPDGLHCGEWDYIDHIFLRKLGSAISDSLNIELARMISPYGWRLDSTWSFSWRVDITDFGFLLHDSVLIEFKHTGYEKNDDRGWLVTLDFEITRGQPAIEIYGMDTLWCGRFPYGDTSQPIEDLLMPIEISHDKAEIARLRIHQTGHGMDSYENCAEFCKKYRRVNFDGELVDWRELWRECGDNPLHPQAGTWIFDRANWCPGQIVYPDIIDNPMTPDSTHTIDIEMQAYLNTEDPTANWSIFSYIFYGSKPWAKNDVSLEEIIVPSSSSQYSWTNPACARPVIKIKNSGSEVLTSTAIYYGTKVLGYRMYTWRGRLESQQTTKVIIPDEINLGNMGHFIVQLSSPNEAVDEYPQDNELYAMEFLSPILPSEFYVAFRNNNEPTHNSYELRDASGYILGGRALGTMEANSIYQDKYKLDDGCYQLVVSDTAGDGLALWFNTDGGFGSVRILDANMQLIKDFNSDCGSGINYWFTVKDGEENTTPDLPPLVNIFPPRNDGKFKTYLFYNESTDLKIEITHDSLGTVYESSHEKIKDEAVTIDISDQPDGRYIVNVTANGETVTRRVRIRRN